MFKIVLSPQASPTDDAPPVVSGEYITYRGISYDLSPLPEGGQIEIGAPFEGAVTRIGGVIHVKLAYLYNWDAAEDYQSTDWSDYTFTLTDGACPCPIKRRPQLPQEVQS